MSQTTTTTNSARPVDLEALRLQLEEDGKVYCEDPDSEEVREQLLHTLQTNNCREIIAAVVNRDDLGNVYIEAGYRGHVNILEAFLDHGMDVDIKDEYGNTALICGSSNGHEECVRFLLDHNASVDLKNKDGMTAMMIASQYGKTKIVQILLEKNADPDIQNINGMSALMFASVNGCKETVQLLLNHNANIELKDDNGKIALNIARNGKIKEMLLNHVTGSYLLK